MLQFHLPGEPTRGPQRSRSMILLVLWLAVPATLGCSASGDPTTAKPVAAAEPPPDASPSGVGEQATSDDREQADASPPQAGTPEVKKPAAEIEGSNQLATETSPYLLMHANNPVHWLPWGPEAFERAKRENKAVFLSVGYSSCHWCHVMEQESFSDEEIAQFLNVNFICIKVDREERPDVDEVYMKAVQIFNQLRGGPPSGGWPMSVFMTPSGKPFFGGTYFPARDGDRGAGMGFLSLIKRIDELWNNRQEDLEKDAETLTELVRRELNRQQPERPLDGELIQQALESLSERFDPKFGGFGFDEANPSRPKFPEPSNLLFLIQQLDSGRLSEDDADQAEKMLVVTLEQMAMGGIRDHLGGGFHRYSVDRFWRIPHFEKMLYDNGQLASVYAEAYRITDRAVFRRAANEILTFVLREMTDPQGGFYSALDADSEHEEGKFYRWEKEEVEALLEPAAYERFAEVYGLDQDPNFEGEYYAPQLSQPLSELATDLGTSEEGLLAELAPARQTLFEHRSLRTRPLTDTKILTSWNGLMIRGFADAGRLLDEPRYLDAAAKAADFVLTELTDPSGRLLRTYAAGEAKLNAYLDDYAFFVDGLIALHRATGEEKWLRAAERLTSLQIELFWNEEEGGFFFTSSDHESLIARGRDPFDGAEPSGNSVAVDNLIYLAEQTDDAAYYQRAEQALKAASGLLAAAPSAAPRMMVALDRWLNRDSPSSPN